MQERIAQSTVTSISLLRFRRRNFNFTSAVLSAVPARRFSRSKFREIAECRNAARENPLGIALGSVRTRCFASRISLVVFASDFKVTITLVEPETLSDIIKSLVALRSSLITSMREELSKRSQEIAPLRETSWLASSLKRGFRLIDRIAHIVRASICEKLRTNVYLLWSSTRSENLGYFTSSHATD